MTLKRKYHKIMHTFCITKIAPQRWGKTYIRQNIVEQYPHHRKYILLLHLYSILENELNVVTN